MIGNNRKSKKFMLCFFTYIYCFFFLTFFLFEVFFSEITGINSYYDILGQWCISAYALRGIDPYPLIGIDTPFLSDVGTIALGWNVIPWGILLNNLFYFGFIPYLDALVLFYLFNFLVYLTGAYYLFRYMKIHYPVMCKYFLIFYLFSFFHLMPFHTGNCGELLCYLLFLCFITYEKYPVLAGFLFSIIMIKPQFAGIFLCMFLFLKAYKMVFVSLGSVLIYFITVCLMIDKLPLDLMSEFFAAKIGIGHSFNGLFTLLFYGNTYISIFVSFLFGLVCLCLYMKYYYPKVKHLNIAFRFFPVCIISTFYSYTSYNEMLVIMLFYFVVLYYFYYSSNDYVVLFSYFTLVGILIFNIIFFISSYYLLSYVYTFFVLFLLFTSLYYCYLVLQENQKLVFEKN